MPVIVPIVDDEPDMETMFRHEVRRGLYSLDFALSGYESLAKLDGRVGEDVILLVSDINMPGMPGLQLLPVVKERRPGLPVFMISANDDKDTVTAAMESGANKFLARPVDFAQRKQGVTALVSDARGTT